MFYSFFIISLSLSLSPLAIVTDWLTDTYVREMAGPEYGTTEAAWKGVLVESDRLSDLHTKIKDHLSEDVPAQIKSWQKDAYHKVQCLYATLDDQMVSAGDNEAWRPSPLFSFSPLKFFTTN